MFISTECYTVVSDLHFNSHKQNRFNYYQECLDVIDQIHAISDKADADKKYLISLGDMVDRGKTVLDMYDKVSQLVKLLITPYDKTYITLGNHSKTYHINNPLFSFIQSFDTNALVGWKAKPLSLTRDIIVTDRLEFENVEFIFRHYKTFTTKSTEKTGLLFMHDDLYPPGAEALIPYVTSKYSGSISEFGFVFNGHLHSIRTVWQSGQAQVHNLGSLLRTKSEEVLDADLIRSVPVIYIENGFMHDIKLEFVTLPPREQVYKEEAYAEQKEKYILAKERRANRDLGKLFTFGKDPLVNVEEAVRTSNNMMVRALWGRIKGELK